MRSCPIIFFLICLATAIVSGQTPSGIAEFNQSIRPVLENYCFDCHADGANKGNVAFDEFPSAQAVLDDKTLWEHALRNLRAGLMPPAGKARPTDDERALITRWIKQSVFQANPQNPDPGRVTLRRLNRVEYRNTIRDLLGVDYDTASEFPADDTGYGFDNIGDVLTLPPMLMEKYLRAANAIIQEAVPTMPRAPVEQTLAGGSFSGSLNERRDRNDPLVLSYYQPAAVSNTFTAEHEGDYQIAVTLTVNEKYVDNVFDYNKCRLTFTVDGAQLLQKEFSWEGGKAYHFDFDRKWAAGDHQLAFQLEPLTPNAEQTRTLTLRLKAVTVRGPMNKKFWVRTAAHKKFFPKEAPAGTRPRREYATQLLGDFARRAYRRPVDSKTLNRLVTLAETTYRQSGKTFESGIAQAMVAVLASPRFLFHAEGIEPAQAGQYPLVDEYALASRLSYFLWSSMPDEELFQLAAEGKLRANLSAQTARLLADPKSSAFIRNFTGQWLQARDIETVSIEARSVLAREENSNSRNDSQRERFQALRDKPPEQLTPQERDEIKAFQAEFQRRRRPPRADLTSDLRRAMREETEDYFEYVIRQDRNLLELVDSDYTFLNEQLAQHYGITNVTGKELHRVILPPGSPRGGVLTQGTVLAVTSNPTRTSPVKRGVFILDNILGTPPGPPPPNIPPLDAAAAHVAGKVPTLRETLAVHRENALCSSCHNRMDPLGLAMENFNALGMWRDQEYGQSIETGGKLITGEEFQSIQQMKQILVEKYGTQFYRTITEKMLIYALGRGLEYYDVETVDEIVDRIQQSGGRASALLAGVIESAAFQRTRFQSVQTSEANAPAPSPKTRAALVPEPLTVAANQQENP